MMYLYIPICASKKEDPVIQELRDLARRIEERHKAKEKP